MPFLKLLKRQNPGAVKTLGSAAFDLDPRRGRCLKILQWAKAHQTPRQISDFDLIASCISESVNYVQNKI